VKANAPGVAVLAAATGCFGFGCFVASLAIAAAAVGSAALYRVARGAGAPTRVIMILVGALGAGLGSEIVRTLVTAASNADVVEGGFRRSMLDAAAVALVIVAALAVGTLLARLLRR